jgi:hypothetical protein
MRVDPKKMLLYYVKVLLAAAAFLGLLFILPIPAEMYREHISLANPSDLFAVPGIYRRLIRDMLPGILAVGAAFFLASNFTASLYKLGTWKEGLDHIGRCIFGQPSLSPTVRVSDGEVKTNDDDILTRVGGPGGIVIYNDSAVVLERGGRLTRVLGPGEIGTLERFEKIRDVIDLRPMRWEYEVDAMSKEGIPVTLYADVHFQIDMGHREPTQENPYPALEEAIFRASTSRCMRDADAGEDEQYLDWARCVILGETESTLRSIIARYPINALVGLEPVPTSNTDHTHQAVQEEFTAASFATAQARRENHPREAIQTKLKQKLREPAAKLGAQINKVQLGTIKVSGEVIGQWIEAWQAREAAREQLREQAKAQEKADVITAMAQAFRQPVIDDDPISHRRIVEGLVDILEHFTPEAVADTVDQLRELLAENPA